MAYQSIDKLKVYMQKKIDAIVTGEQVKFNINAHQLLDEISEMEHKAKAWEQFKNDYHTEITQAIDNLFKLNNMDIAGEIIFLLEKILSDLEDE